jgi:hypothetical protein
MFKRVSFILVFAALVAVTGAIAGFTLAQDNDDTDEGQSELQVLQINFTYDMTATEYEEAVAPLAEPIAEVEGVVWKMWVINDENKEAGGIYLFEDAASVNDYLSGEIVAGLAAHPQITDIVVKQFDVMESVSLFEFCADSLLLTHWEHSENRRNRGQGNRDTRDSSHQHNHPPGKGLLFGSD